MRRNVLTTMVASLALTLLLATSAAQAAFIFTARLSGGQEVPPVVTDRSGSARLTLDEAMSRLEVDTQLFGFDLDGLQTDDPDDDVIGAHIHRGAAGENGPVVFGFINPDTNPGELVIDAIAGTIFGVWNLDEGVDTTLAEELDNLFAGDLYINIHTRAFPAGEVRGQIRQVPEPATLLLGLLGGLALVSVQRRGRETPASPILRPLDAIWLGHASNPLRAMTRPNKV